ncbi:MAG: hypothetical protein E4H14_07395 [Candidatus Thorarchaeota archaeon]|nr:MAG: hypothetical protein E4H14_07395 [Candidatus Thorarchaeota archaeon]
MRFVTLSILIVIISGIVLLGPIQPQMIAQDTTSIGEKMSSEGLDVLFCSYFGGDGEEWSNDICFTDDGGFVLSGMTRSDDLPVHNAHQNVYAGAGDIFLVKVSSQFQVEFYTYFGGNGLEEPMALTIDHDGSIILAGGTSSSDLTTLNPFQEELNGTSDAFIAKFSPSGVLLFSTYLGGSNVERIEDVLVDSYGNYLIVGPTGSSDFYTTSGTHQDVYGGGDSDVFITSLSNDGQSIIYSSYFGNTTNEDAWAVGIDLMDNLVVVGITDGDAIATDSAYQQTYGGGQTDTFVAKFAPNCTSLSWSTLLGGNGWEFGDQVDFDSDNNIVVSGYTGSSDYPLVDQLYNDSSGYDAFFSKLNPDGENLLLSSYLGGNSEDRSYAMKVLADDSILITSPASSANMPVQNAFQNYSGGSDGYIALIGGEEPTILFGSYYGGSSNDYVLGMSVYEDDMIAVIGYTSSDDLPTINAIQDEYRGSSDSMVWGFGFERIQTDNPPILAIITVVIVVIAIVAVVLVFGLRRR